MSLNSITFNFPFGTDQTCFPRNGLKSDVSEYASGELEAPQSEQRELSPGYLKIAVAAASSWSPFRPLGGGAPLRQSPPTVVGLLADPHPTWERRLTPPREEEEGA